MRRSHRCAGKPTRHLARARLPDLEAAWPALEDERVVDGAHGQPPAERCDLGNGHLALDRDLADALECSHRLRAFGVESGEPDAVRL